MAGNKKTAITTMKKHGKDFYRINGAKGGKATKGYKFAHGKIDPSEAGKLGGRPKAND